jgi:hypothetical protein
MKQTLLDKGIRLRDRPEVSRQEHLHGLNLLPVGKWHGYLAQLFRNGQVFRGAAQPPMEEVQDFR